MKQGNEPQCMRMRQDSFLMHYTIFSVCHKCCEARRRNSDRLRMRDDPSSLAFSQSGTGRHDISTGSKPLS